MPRDVAILRGINLGKRRLPMSRLNRTFEEIGFDDIATFISSGNVIFSSRRSPGSIEAIVEMHLEANLGYPTDSFVRCADRVIEIGECAHVQEGDRAADAQSGTLHIGFFKAPLRSDLAERMSNVRTDVDELVVTGSEYFWHSQVGVSQSKVWALPQLRALNLPSSTMRNMTSIRKFIAKHLV